MAEGEAEAIVKVAGARADEIKLVNEAAEKHFKGNAQLLKRLEVTKEALEENTKYVIGAEKDISLVLNEAAGVVPIKGVGRKPTPS